MPEPRVITVLAFDFGMKRIGVAIGQSLTSVANPLKQLSAQDGIPDWDKIQSLINEWHTQQLVVGYPLNMDGSTQIVTHAAKRFANRLKHRFQLPVDLIDERLTTLAARDWAYEAKQRQSQSIDSIAAKLMLEAWFRQYNAPKS